MLCVDYISSCDLSNSLAAKTIKLASLVTSKFTLQKNTNTTKTHYSNSNTSTPLLQYNKINLKQATRTCHLHSHQQQTPTSVLITSGQATFRPTPSSSRLRRARTLPTTWRIAFCGDTLAKSLRITLLLAVLLGTASISICLQDTNQDTDHNKTVANDNNADPTAGLTALGASGVASEPPALLFDNSDNGDSIESLISPDPLSDSTPSFASELSTTTSETTTPSSNEDDESVSADDNNFAALGDESEPNASVSSFEKPQNVSHYMDYIETLFTDLRSQIKDLLEPHMPQLIRSSSRLELSASCSYDVLRFAIALRAFEPWALKMIDSAGKVPEGILEGSFTALGAYDQCVNIVFGGASEQQQQSPVSRSTFYQDSASASASSSDNNNNNNKQATVKPTRGKYCLVTVSPFMPPKPPADKVERMFLEEAERRNYSQGNQFSRLSAMFYYMKFRIGVCLPSTCSTLDTLSMANSLRKILRLNITIPHCSSKAEPKHAHQVQVISGLSFGLVTCVCLLATFVHLLRNFAYNLSRKENRKKQVLLVAINSLANKNSLIQDEIKSSTNVVAIESHSHQSIENLNNNKQFSSNLTSLVLAFSIILNNKLYFNSKAIHLTAFHNNTPNYNNSSLSKNQNTNTNKRPQHNAKLAIREQKTISCLNGIRALSLCWVIVANSYVTLDPRATRGLTKCREAPKDFMFQLVVQASLAIETFFFLSGLLLAASYTRRLSSSNNNKLMSFVSFYVHRYLRITPPTMLVLAMTLFVSKFGDGPLWNEATANAIDNCSKNWWLHLVHGSNWLDTRQMCFVHYWYVSADMQLCVLAPLLLYLLDKNSSFARKALGYATVGLASFASLVYIFYVTYMRNLPPTLLFHSPDPESRREFINLVMTKPQTHVLPYMIGLMLGRYLFATSSSVSVSSSPSGDQELTEQKDNNKRSIANYWRLAHAYWLSFISRLNIHKQQSFVFKAALGAIVSSIALVELFLPYSWNHSYLPSALISAFYACLFRLCWALMLTWVVVACKHRVGRKCVRYQPLSCLPNYRPLATSSSCSEGAVVNFSNMLINHSPLSAADNPADTAACYCGSGGNLLNKLLGLSIFTFLSKVSFVAYLVHVPLMSAFVAQTRGLFAFSHMLVMHLAFSYMMLTFIVSFVLVHIVEYPFITLEAMIIARWHGRRPQKLATCSISSCATVHQLNDRENK